MAVGFFLFVITAWYLSKEFRNAFNDFPWTDRITFDATVNCPGMKPPPSHVLLTKEPRNKRRNPVIFVWIRIFALNRTITLMNAFRVRLNFSFLRWWDPTKAHLQESVKEMENREKLTVDVEQEKHKQYRGNEAEMKEERKLITSHM